MKKSENSLNLKKSIDMKKSEKNVLTKTVFFLQATTNRLACDRANLTLLIGSIYVESLYV